MKRLVIICEGETEQSFCNTILAPDFISRGIIVQAPLLKHSHGGIVRWDILKKQIETTLKTETEVYVTLLIDYYGLYSKHGFPKWEVAEQYIDKNERMSFLESSMKDDIDDSIRYRFIPYIQLHEFEGLLFCDKSVFETVIPEKDLVGYEELEQTLTIYPNPELINTSKETSPSHRLLRIIRGYNKVVYGNILAETIGLNKIREKCPRFNNWIRSLICIGES